MLQRKSLGDDQYPLAADILHSSEQNADTAPSGSRFVQGFGQVSALIQGRANPSAKTGERTRKKARLQRKLTVGASNDPLEREADLIADQVIAVPAHSVGAAPPRIQRSAAASTPSAEAPASVDRALARSGRPLDTRLRRDMERRFGYDFSQVRVHSGGDAERSAQDVNAQAYTVGHDIVFGAGRYDPETKSGRRLLAHELVHVVQQTGDLSLGVIRRSEVDDRSCAGLPDIAGDIDTKVNAEIAAARTAAASPMVVMDFLRDVENRLGGAFVGSIEKFIQGLPTTKRTDPKQDLSNTKFSGVEAVNRFYKLQTLGSVLVVGPAANVKGFCVGSDKFGHFFEEGFLYFQLAKAGAKAADLDQMGNFLEISATQGLGVTGVFSNADKAANLAGKQFYLDLEADPKKYKFSVSKYITKDWSETSNPSFYASSEGNIIWANLITGAWDGKFTSGGSTTTIDAKVDLKATAAGVVTGSYVWPATAAKPNKEIIKNGKIIPKTTSVSGTNVASSSSPTNSASPISGVTIEFDWEATTSSGKGTLTSVDEQNLVGTWGIGTSRTSGGTWTLKKT